MTAPPAPLVPAPARVDAVAARRALARLAGAAQLGEAPWLHQEAARRMAERLAWIKHQPREVLDWSAPAGASTELLGAAYPRALHRHVSEALATGAAPTAWWRRWLGRGGSQPVDVAQIASAQAGLLWSNMRLHFAPDPLRLLRAWRQVLTPNGFLMFSTLGPGSLTVLRELYAAAGWGPAHAPFVDMHDLGDMLVESGFAEPVMDQETLTLRYSSADRLIDELHGIGANAAPERFTGLRTPRWRDRLYALLTERAEPDGRIALTVELVYGHAFVAAPGGPRVEAQTNIALNDMKLMLRKPGPEK
jgi:malonyl-CoA O-methyltransferase